ncbi:MgtC/SapB family protein [Dinghuibacter silviterrae]|uniref:Putative Mg2+ transporter-C (MgtC) family protein n=1 Tax=Dinghuibacter silviterrae TaxID=1539049 RepID=A0A4R8DP47_9BACT|nr:MgtC/SapB family protein [Dinghuibacter silviterrae]TDW99194.1 putative Mg2+ transporter-C (MgtC) family protein [Dinghuibacter silviterrae]
MHANIEDIYKLLVALGLGAVLGLEREYRSKAAGFRTLTMISVGACLFTILSQMIGGAGNPDRIASNVVQGIGFLGAGVIFKDNFSVSGLTTATAIWVSSAIGMAAGSGSFALAAFTTAAALVVLSAFEIIQSRVDRLHQYRQYRVSYKMEELTASHVEDDFKRSGLRYRKQKQSRDGMVVTSWYEVFGNEGCFQALDKVLLADERILSFDN